MALAVVHANERGRLVGGLRKVAAYPVDPLRPLLDRNFYPVVMQDRAGNSQGVQNQIVLRVPIHARNGAEELVAVLLQTRGLSPDREGGAALYVRQPCAEADGGLGGRTELAGGHAHRRP